MRVEEIFTEKILANFSQEELIAFNDILYHENETKQAVLSFRLSTVSIYMDAESGLYNLRFTKPVLEEKKEKVKDEAQ